MNKLQSIETLDALDRAVDMKEMTEREIMSEILQAWVRVPPQQTRLITDSLHLLKKSSPNLGDRGIIELAAKLGMFLKSKEG